MGYNIYSGPAYGDDPTANNAIAAALGPFGPYITEALAASETLVEIGNLLASLNAVEVLLDGTGGEATPVAATTAITANTTTTLGTLNTIARNLGLKTLGTSYATIDSALTGILAVKDRKCAPGALGTVAAAPGAGVGWVRQDALDLAKTAIDATTGVMTITVAPGDTIIISAELDTLVSGTDREQELTFDLTVSGAWTDNHVASFAMVRDLNAGAGAFTIVEPMLHRTAGSVGATAGPPSGMVMGGSFEYAAGPLHYVYSGKRCAGEAASVTACAPGSSATAPPAKQHVTARIWSTRAGGEAVGGRYSYFTQTVGGEDTTGNNTWYSSQGLLAYFANALELYPRVRAAMCFKNTGVTADVVYVVNSITYKKSGFNI